MDRCRDYRREAWKNQLGPSCGEGLKLLDSQFRIMEGIERKDLIFIDNPETRPMAQDDTGVGRREASTQEVRAET